MFGLYVVCAHASSNAIFDKYNLIGMLIFFFLYNVYKSTINWIHFDIAYVFISCLCYFCFFFFFIFVCSDSLLYAYCFIAIVVVAAVVLFSQTLPSPFVSLVWLLLVGYLCCCWWWWWWCWDILLARRLVYCHNFRTMTYHSCRRRRRWTDKRISFTEQNHDFYVVVVAILGIQNIQKSSSLPYPTIFHSEAPNLQHTIHTMRTHT